MKAWMRANPQDLPAGIDANEHTSYQIRRELVAAGWALEELSDRVLLIEPDLDGDTSFADRVLGEVVERGQDASELLEEAEEITFGLERDLQSALRANIQQLEPGLRITDEGKERSTEAGRI